MRIKRVVVDPPSVVLQSNIVDPSTSRAAGSATGVSSTVDQSNALGDISRGFIGCVIDHRGVAELSHHFGKNRGVARSISDRSHLDPLRSLVQRHTAEIAIEDSASIIKDSTIRYSADASEVAQATDGHSTGSELSIRGVRRAKECRDVLLASGQVSRVCIDSRVKSN